MSEVGLKMMGNHEGVAKGVKVNKDGILKRLERVLIAEHSVTSLNVESGFGEDVGGYSSTTTLSVDDFKSLMIRITNDFPVTVRIRIRAYKEKQTGIGGETLIMYDQRISQGQTLILTEKEIPDLKLPFPEILVHAQVSPSQTGGNFSVMFFGGQQDNELGLVKTEMDRQSRVTVLERLNRSAGTFSEVLELPKNAYGAVLHLITRDWTEDSGASARIRVRPRFSGYDMFGYNSQKIIYDDLSGGKSARLPTIETVYVCPEAMYLKEYPPEIESGGSSFRFLQLTLCPVRLTDRLSVALTIEGEVECELFCEYLM